MKWYTSSSSVAARDSSGTSGSGRANELCAARMLSLLLIARPGREGWDGEGEDNGGVETHG
jgi:hypothetical protein